MFNRTLKAVCSAILGFALFSAGVVQATPPAQQFTQVPGFYRMALGEFEVTALYDGFIDMPTTRLKGVSDADLQSLLARMFVASSKGMQTAVNGYIVNTGSNLILVDTGGGKCYGANLGGIVGNLRAAGYEPSQIDTVLLTHLHPDHVCGLLAAEGVAAFPNAQVRVAKADADYWLSEEVAAKAPQDQLRAFKMAQAAVAPYQRSGHFKPFTVTEPLLPGISIVAADGHTPGHSSFLFSSGGQSLLLWGDIVHSHATQFAHPEISFDADTDSTKAIATRKKLFADAAKNKLWVGGAHLPFPGLGHVRADKQAYTWVPIEYGPVRRDR